MGGRFRKLRPVPRQSAEQLAKTVRLFADNLVFSSAHMHEGELRHLQLVFMPIMFGALDGVDKGSIGVIYEELNQAGPRCLNGMPMFFSCYLLHKDDWTIVRNHLPIHDQKRRDLDAATVEAIKGARRKGG